MDRAPGLSVRLKLTLSYAGFVMLAGALLLAAVWVFLLRDVPYVAGPGGVISRSVLARNFAPAAATVSPFLLVFGLLRGWLLAGRARTHGPSSQRSSTRPSSRRKQLKRASPSQKHAASPSELPAT